VTFSILNSLIHTQRLTFLLGGEWKGNCGLAPCPVCQPEQRSDQRALSLRSDGGRLLTFCHKSGCAFRDILRALPLGRNHYNAIVDPSVASQAHINRAQYESQQLAKARQLWEHSKPLLGTKGEAYLRARGITCELPPSLRWAADTYHSPSARWHSAIIADVSSGGVHRTFFDESGERLTKNAKMMQGPCAGGAVQLINAAGPLVVAEGIETALSLASGLLSGPATIWASLSTAGLVGLILPPVASRLTIAIDGDDAGRKAGYALAERATALGWTVDLLPASDGQDWNDILCAKGATQ
jgi:hypothetical protein